MYLQVQDFLSAKAGRSELGHEMAQSRPVEHFERRQLAGTRLPSHLATVGEVAVYLRLDPGQVTTLRTHSSESARMSGLLRLGIASDGPGGNVHSYSLTYI